VAASERAEWPGSWPSANVTVLSGLAALAHPARHDIYLGGGGRTVAVLGHGFDHLYPKENATLAETIAERGALVSLFFPPTPPTPRTFPMRNVVTSGMGQGTIVVEASKTSGARLQARLAIEHGKHAFLLQSLLDDHEWARDFALKEGAVVVSEVGEVLRYLRDPAKLARSWEEHAPDIIAANAEPPVYVQRRLSRVAARGQEQLTFD
jgi:DNA processing protein